MKLVLRLPYYLYPNEPMAEVPTLLFLHGVGEGFSNNGQIGHRNLTQQGPPKYLESLPSPAVPLGHPMLRLTVVAPQLPDRETLWSDVVGDLKEILARHRPAGKLYIMGFSKGGLGAFQVGALLQADALVAIDASPMSQSPRDAISQWVKPLAERPFWAIHTGYAPTRDSGRFRNSTRC